MKIRFVFEDGSERIYENHELTGTGKGLLVRVETFPKEGSVETMSASILLGMKVLGKVLR
jgi:hypothetical protein